MKPNYRIIMISHGYFPRIGGAERQLMDLAPLLQKKGIETHIITRRLTGTVAYEIIKGVPVYRLPTLKDKTFSSILFTLNALKLIRKLNPDLIHAHELISPATTALLAKWFFGYPLVITVHRSGPLGEISRLKSRNFGKYRLKVICRNIDMFIIISNEIDQELANEDVPAQKRVFIPNGVDVKRFAPPRPGIKQKLRASLGLPLDSKIVVFAGRFSPEKRVANLIKVWPDVRKNIPVALLLLLGNGPEEYLLRQMAGDGVLFGGGQSNVLPYLQVSDLFVLPSIAEGVSVALLEAMSCGLPVVATSVGGAPEIIQHQKTGWLISPDDTNGLLSGILTLLSDEDSGEQLGKNAREYVSRNCDINKSADLLCDTYQQILKIEVKEP